MNLDGWPGWIVDDSSCCSSLRPRSSTTPPTLLLAITFVEVVAPGEGDSRISFKNKFVNVEIL